MTNRIQQARKILEAGPEEDIVEAAARVMKEVHKLRAELAQVEIPLSPEESKCLVELLRKPPPTSRFLTEAMRRRR